MDWPHFGKTKREEDAMNSAKVPPSSGKDFEAAVAVGQISPRAQGRIETRLRSCIERKGTFSAIIAWHTLDDHTVGFRGGALFPKSRGLTQPYFAEPLTVLHEPVSLDAFGGQAPWDCGS